MAKKEQSRKGRAFFFYVDDWLSSKTIEMMDAHEERGYLRLLLNAWTSPDCGLPDSEVELSVLSKLGAQWNKPTREKEKRIPGVTSGQKLMKCFERYEGAAGRVYNARLLSEWRYQQEVKKERISAAKAGVVKKRETRANGQQSESKTRANGQQSESKTEANGQHLLNQTVKQSASNIVSCSVSDSVVDCSLKNQIRSREPEVALDLARNRARLEEIFGIFVALGKGISFSDQTSCTNRWDGYTLPQQIKAHRCAAESLLEWQARETHLIPMPKNWFRENQWERHAPRLLPQISPVKKSRAEIEMESL